MEESVKPCQAITIIVQHSLFYTLLSILSYSEKCDVGKTSFPPSSIEINDDSNKKGKKLASNYHKTSFWDYENEKMNDYDNWSDPFGDERAFYDGWSREDVESGLADAYE